jgi:hypothetical protein
MTFRTGMVFACLIDRFEIEEGVGLETAVHGHYSSDLRFVLTDESVSPCLLSTVFGEAFFATINSKAVPTLTDRVSSFYL